MGEKMSRREFLRASATLAVSTAAFAPDEEPKPQMPLRPLGRTGVKVAILGMGGLGFLVSWEDKERVTAFLNEIIDEGVNYFNTARAYGKSEENLGLVTGTTRRKEIFLATKTVSRTYDGALKDVEVSLKALRTDYLDLIQLHGFGCDEQDDVAAIGRRNGVFPAFLRLKEEKVARFIGITGHPHCPEKGWSGQKLKEAIATYDFDVVLCFANPKAESRWVERELIPLAQEKGMGIVGMKVFGGGKPAALVGEGKGKAPAPLLLRYALTLPIATVVPCVFSREEFRQNLEVARSFTPMSEADRKALIDRINPP